jgi:hypothetical protein
VFATGDGGNGSMASANLVFGGKFWWWRPVQAASCAAMTLLVAIRTGLATVVGCTPRTSAALTSHACLWLDRSGCDN